MSNVIEARMLGASDVSAMRSMLAMFGKAFGDCSASMQWAG
jgi:hypothetical protein